MSNGKRSMEQAPYKPTVREIWEMVIPPPCYMHKPIGCHQCKYGLYLTCEPSDWRKIHDLAMPTEGQ